MNHNAVATSYEKDIFGQPWQTLDSPAMMLDAEVLASNITGMQARAKNSNVALRPHVKTHKNPQIIAQQLAAGASRGTAAKLDEAELLFQAGVKDVLLANQLATRAKLDRAAAMAKYHRLVIGADSPQGIAGLADAAQRANVQIGVSVEIDCGLNRCGVFPNGAADLARLVDGSANLWLEGVFTHGGQAYGCLSREALAQVAEDEISAAVAAAQAIRDYGIVVPEVSIGSTPTMLLFAGHPEITEIRPGNYVFMDGIQKGLGVAGEADCALTLGVTVISRPAADRAVVDAGSKSLGLDRGAHGMALLDHYGAVLGEQGVLARLSEEHGVLSIPPDSDIAIGDRLRILPNHACVASNLAQELWIVKQGLCVDRWALGDARGGH